MCLSSIAKLNCLDRRFQTQNYHFRYWYAYVDSVIYFTCKVADARVHLHHDCANFHWNFVLHFTASWSLLLYFCHCYLTSLIAASYARPFLVNYSSGDIDADQAQSWPRSVSLWSSHSRYSRPYSAALHYCSASRSLAVADVTVVPPSSDLDPKLRSSSCSRWCLGICPVHSY